MSNTTSFTLTDDSFKYDIKSLISSKTFNYDNSVNEDNRINHDNINKSDTNGYTPLCYAVLNNIDPKYILALLKEDVDLSLKCARGKSPIQYACMSMNIDAIKILLGDNNYSIKEQTEYDEDNIDVISFNIANNINNISVSTTHSFYFLSVEDKNKVYSEENYYGDTYSYIPAIVSNNDLLDASILPKYEILYALKSSINKDNINIVDDYGNSLLMLTCTSQCYKSIDTILNLNIKDNNNNIVVPDITILNKNGYWAFSIAENLDDTGIQNKLLDHINANNKQYLNQFNNVITEDDLDTSYINELSTFAKFIVIKYDANSSIWLETILVNNYSNLFKLLINFNKIIITSSDLLATSINNLSSASKIIVNTYNSLLLNYYIEFKCYNIIALLNNFAKLSLSDKNIIKQAVLNNKLDSQYLPVELRPTTTII